MFEHELEERGHVFAKSVRFFCRKLKKDTGQLEDIKQLVRASGSVGANYIEANEKLGKRDILFRIRIARKEAKECMHFLGLIETFGDRELESERVLLIDEVVQLRKIFSAMLIKLENHKA